jgi:hypothetical protein
MNTFVRVRLGPTEFKISPSRTLATVKAQTLSFATMRSQAEQAWLGTGSPSMSKYRALHRFRDEIVEGSYVNVRFKEQGICLGRVAFKGDIHSKVGAERFVTIYFPGDDSFWDLNMWGKEGKMVNKVDTPPIDKQFKIPPDALHDFEEVAEPENAIEEVAEPENAIEEVAEPENAIEEVVEPEKKKRKKRKSLYTHKKKRRVNKE